MSLGFDARLLVVVLAAFAVASTLASVVVAARWNAAVRGAGDLAPGAVARRLLALRSAPTAAGASFAALAGAAFARFEPTVGPERVGPAVLGAAALALGLLAAWLVRSLRTAGATAELVRRSAGATRLAVAGCPVDVREVKAAFPVVALAGHLTPRMLVASQVVEACTPEELDAIVAHELAHLRAHDNLAGALFATSPDLLAWLPAAGAMERAWREASEQAADERATGADERRRLALASALLRVARLAAAQARPPLVASALFRGEPIADRVRRLMAPPVAASDRRAAGHRPGRVAAALVLAAGAAALVAFAVAGPHLFAVIEAAIRLGR